MNILMSGSRGLIGRHLKPAFAGEGWNVTPLIHLNGKKKNNDALYWDVVQPFAQPDRLEAFDAVVHLAGENISEGRWTKAKKERIVTSRVEGTKRLVEALLKLKKPPKIFISASAIGFYGDRGDENLDESSSPSSSFLSETCKAWEEASKPLAEKGIRVVHLRFGVILTAEGGALKKMLFPFQMGVGGKIGSGEQYISWVAIDDVVDTIVFALKSDSLSGPVNVVSPNPVTNLEFTKTLGSVVKKPTIFPLPGFMAELIFGEMAKELLLASTRVRPKKLMDAGYTFHLEKLEPALIHLITR